MNNRLLAVDFEILDIKTLLQDIVRILKPITKEKNILLELIAEDNLPPVWTDYDKLKQLLIIFIDNAKEDILFIGERFYKADKARKYSDNGTRLELSIAKHLVKLLNCKLKIESEVNVGTEIKINFLKFKEKIHL